MIILTKMCQCFEKQNISSFRRPTLLASPTPKYCFKGVGEAGPKNEGEVEIAFFINFYAVLYF